MQKKSYLGTMQKKCIFLQCLCNIYSLNNLDIWIFFTNFAPIYKTNMVSSYMF